MHCLLRGRFGRCVQSPGRGTAMARIATEPSFLEQHKRLNKYKPRANNRSWAAVFDNFDIYIQLPN